MFRGEPTVDDITPAAELPMVALGRIELGMIEGIKKLATELHRSAPQSVTFLNTEQSRLVRCGPRRMLRPPLPCNGPNATEELVHTALVGRGLPAGAVAELGHDHIGQGTNALLESVTTPLTPADI